MDRLLYSHNSVAGYGNHRAMCGINESAVLGAIVVRDPAIVPASHDVHDWVAACVFQPKDVPNLVGDDVGLFMGRALGESLLVHDYLTLDPFGLATAAPRKCSGVPVLDVDEHRLDGCTEGGKRCKNQGEDVGSHVPHATPASQPRGLGVV